RPGAIRGVERRRCFVVVRIGLLDDVDLARTANCIEPTSFAVVKDFVGIAANVDSCDYGSRIGVEYDDLRWQAAADKQPMICFIQRHWKIRERQICLPSRDDFAFLAIDHRNVPSIRNVHKDALSKLLQLERFRMGGKFDFSDLLSVRSIDGRDSTAAE